MSEKINHSDKNIQNDEVWKLACMPKQTELDECKKILSLPETTCQNHPRTSSFIVNEININIEKG